MAGIPPTREFSWQQKVIEADPNYQKNLQRPIIYEFSNGRQFVKDPNQYTD